MRLTLIVFAILLVLVISFANGFVVEAKKPTPAPPPSASPVPTPPLPQPYQ